jgi:hypothetical protein
VQIEVDHVECLSRVFLGGFVATPALKAGFDSSRWRIFLAGREFDVLAGDVSKCILHKSGPLINAPNRLSSDYSWSTTRSQFSSRPSIPESVWWVDKAIDQ